MAGAVALHETPDFRDALLAAARALDLDERFVEKDYYVTAILRIVAAQLPGKTIFKGGTSLSKGWGLIDRFSEDIDLYVHREAWDPPLNDRRLDRVLRDLRDSVASHPAFTYLEDEKRVIGGVSREDNFAYESLFDELPGLRSVVRLEPGVQSGTQPVQEVELNSLVAQFLRDAGQGDTADDLEPFLMTLLHFRRTFVEKLFTIHSKVERLKSEDHPIGRDARHYADLHLLGRRNEVLAMLRSAEYAEIKSDYAETSRRFYPQSYRPPDDLSFATSDALFPSSGLRDRLEPDYETECQRLFPGEYPAFTDVLATFESLRELL